MVDISKISIFLDAWKNSIHEIVVYKFFPEEANRMEASFSTTIRLII